MTRDVEHKLNIDFTEQSIEEGIKILQEEPDLELGCVSAMCTLSWLSITPTGTYEKL